MGEKNVYLFFIVLYLAISNCLCALTYEQTAFIALAAPPKLLLEKCNALFNHLILYQKTREKICSEKIIVDYLALANFSILKIDRRNKTKKYEGDLKIIAQHPLIEDYIIKMQLPLPTMYPPTKRTQYNISRIQGATILRSALQELHCSSIIIPHKYIYHLPGAPEELDDNNYLVLSEKLPIWELKSPMNHLFHSNKKKFIDDLKQLIDATGYYDVKPENIYLTTNNRLAIIDTEVDRDFWNPLKPFNWIKGLSLLTESWLGKKNLSKLDK